MRFLNTKTLSLVALSLLLALSTACKKNTDDGKSFGTKQNLLGVWEVKNYELRNQENELICVFPDDFLKIKGLGQVFPQDIDLDVRQTYHFKSDGTLLCDYNPSRPNTDTISLKYTLEGENLSVIPPSPSGNLVETSRVEFASPTHLKLHRTQSVGELGFKPEEVDPKMIEALIQGLKLMNQTELIKQVERFNKAIQNKEKLNVTMNLKKLP